MKRLCTVLFLVVPFLLTAQEYNFRNILDFNYIDYSNDTYIFETEDTLLYYYSPTVIPLARLTVSKKNYETRTMFQGGLVWIFLPGIYSEMLYGLSTNEDGDLGQDGYVEVVREGDTTVASARFRAGYDHATDVLYIIPDASFKKQFTPLYSLKAKYFFGYNSEDFASHSLQLENGFTFRKYYTATLITTGITEEINEEWQNSWSAGLRLEGTFSKRVTIKYLFQYHSRPNDVWGIENGLTFDWEF